MTNELTQEEKTSLVESKIRTCATMQESLESYVVEETEQALKEAYRIKAEDYKNIIKALEVFKETC
jgi:tRNA A37 N6-isopentenylltransferase MiaA